MVTTFEWSLNVKSGVPTSFSLTNFGQFPESGIILYDCFITITSYCYRADNSVEALLFLKQV